MANDLLKFHHSGEALDILPRLAELVHAAMNGRSILWDRDGVIREVPNVILRAVIDIHHSYVKMLEARPHANPPLHSRYIYWEQTREIKS